MPVMDQPLTSQEFWLPPWGQYIGVYGDTIIYTTYWECLEVISLTCWQIIRCTVAAVNTQQEV